MDRDVAALTLRVDPERLHYPLLTILVDGRDLAEVVGDELKGCDPGALLDGDTPLLPADPPRAVTL
ncbi:MAG TPA: hypothetical protein VF519_06100 [Mycobacteriales bacterium]|jgi:hypothetical protein